MQQRRTDKRASGGLLVTGLLALAFALVSPAATLAADPTPVPTASAQPTDAPSATPSDGGIAIDPTFIIATATPAGSVLAATGRPEVTLPPTDATQATSAATADARGVALLLLVLATICLVPARLPDVRRR